MVPQQTTQLCQLPTKQHSSVSYSQNTTLSVTHKTTQLCQLPTKHSSVSYPQNNTVTHKTVSWDMNRDNNTHIIEGLLRQRPEGQQHSNDGHSHQHNVYICYRKHTLLPSINTMSTSVTENTHCYLASTQCLHLLQKTHIVT